MKSPVRHTFVKYSFILILFAFFSDAAAQERKVYYFDENNNGVKKAKFKRQIDHGKNLAIEYVQGDSLIKKIVLREEEGRLGEDGLKKLRDYLTKCTNIGFLENEIIVIKYHPGKDRNNSTGLGNTEKEYIKYYHQTLKSELKKLKNVNLAYLCKTYEGLELRKKFVPWHLDVDGAVEELFFEYHYPGSSFVVVNTTGEYYAYFGEHAIEHIVDAVKVFKWKNESGG